MRLAQKSVEQIMDFPGVLLPEVRLNTNHVSIIFRAPYWLLGTVLTVCVIRCLQGYRNIDLLLITTIATAVFWLLNRVFPLRRTTAEKQIKESSDGSVT